MVFCASFYSISSTLNLGFSKLSKQFVSGDYFFCSLSIKPHICIVFYSNSFCRCLFVYYIKKVWGYIRVSFVCTARIFIIWKCQFIQGFLKNSSWENFHRAECKIIVFVKFCSLGFSGAKNSWWSDRDVSIILACTTFSLLLVKVWSIRGKLLNVILLGTLINCFNPRVEQNLI